MGFIQGHTTELALPEMARPIQTGMNMPGRDAMHFRQSAPYALPVLRRQDQVDVIWHQPPGPDADVRRLAMPGRQIQIEVIVRSLKNVDARPLPRCVTWRGMPGMTVRARRAMAQI